MNKKDVMLHLFFKYYESESKKKKESCVKLIFDDKEIINKIFI